MKNSISSSAAFMLKYIITISFLFCFTISFAQSKQLKSWVIPPNLITFSETPSFSILDDLHDYDSGTPNKLMNSMTDANGNLLFFIVDKSSEDEVYVYDKNRYLIDKLRIPPVPGKTRSWGEEMSIVPFPGSCSKYYIIGGIKELNSAGFSNFYPVYAILDMSAQNTYGGYGSDPTKKGALQYFGSATNLFDLRAVSPDPATFDGIGYNPNRFGLGVTPYRNPPEDNHLLFINSDGGVIVYKISAGSISYQSSGFSFSIGSMINNGYGEMEVVHLSTGNYRIAKAQSNTFICVADFDSNGNYISLSAKYIQPNPNVEIGSMEFSPSGQFLYFSNSIYPIGTYNIAVHYVDVTVTSPVPLPLATGTTPFPSVNNVVGSIEMAFDCKMYFNASDRLYSLANPDAGPLLSNWTVPLTASLQSGFAGAYSRLLPDQMDGEDYLRLRNSSVSCCLKTTLYNVDNYTSEISARFPTKTQIWTPTNNPFIDEYNKNHPCATITSMATVSVGHDLTILPDFNITIKGMRFEFKPRASEVLMSGLTVTDYGGRVIVQNTLLADPSTGAHLTLTNLGTNGTVFTSYAGCGKGMWEGIEAWGNSALPQGTSIALTKQGYIQIANNSEISNAYHGALAGKTDATNYFIVSTPSWGGGIIKGSRSLFKNNFYDVFFMPYNIGNNKSDFVNCNFLTNDSLIGESSPSPVAHAFLNDVKSIYFKTCSFTNDMDPTHIPYSPYIQTNTSNYPIGIKSYHSQFYCIPNIYGSGLGCTFNNLKYGIYATYYNSSKTVTVDYATFTNNYRGIYLSGAQLVPTIVRSNFFIMPYNAPIINNAAYGVYMNACTGYKVEENYFTTVGATAGINDFGLIVNNSGANVNNIYNNKFEVLYAGIEARAKNYGISTTAFNFNDFGLQLRCNVFTANTIKNADMAITNGGTPDGGIDYHQGYSGDPAGNQFSHSHNDAWNDYFNWSSTVGHRINYITHNDFNRIPELGYYSPYPAILVSTPPAGTDLFDATTDCLSSMTGRSYGFPIDVLQTNIKTYLQNLAPLQLLLANGDALSLYTAISNPTMTAGDLKNLLMSKSPYLSDGVLIAYINKSGVPNGNLKAVLIANSQLTQPVKDALAALSLPNGIKNQINAAQTGTSQRQIVDDKIHYYLYNIAITKNDILRAYVNDSTLEFKTDTLISKIKEDETIDMIGSTKNILADLYVEKGQYAQADSLIDVIALDPTKQDVVKLKRVNKALKQSGQTTDALTTDLVNKAKVYEVAADYGTEGYEVAMNILQKVFDEPYQEPIDELTGASYHSYTPINNDEPIANAKLAVVYPNPNNGSMQLDYELSENETGIVKIMDITGKLIATYVLEKDKTNIAISEAALKNGVYFYQVIVNGEVVNSDKLVIIKN